MIAASRNLMPGTGWYVVGAGAPRYRHDTRTSALAEAKRLAREHAGQRFDVVCCTDSVVVETPVTVTSIDDAAKQEDIPF